MTVSLAEIRQNLSQILVSSTSDAIPIHPIKPQEYHENSSTLVSQAQALWLNSTGWRAKPGSHALIPDAKGLDSVLFAMGENGDAPASALQFGSLPGSLPEGTYTFSKFPGSAENVALAWAMGAYSFRRYLSKEHRPDRKLALPPTCNRESVLDQAQAIWFGRELINIPANDLGPQDLMRALQNLGTEFGAKVTTVSGDALLAQNFPMIHAVGRASDRPPCLGDLTWGKPKHPKITLVGKGICFDTGGLNIKPPQAMALMKKDMGGAAAVMTLGAMIMAAKLPVRLRILIPAADNNISANSFRPGDILQSRAGLTVEIGNTDAEGRLVLADALALADEEKPDLLIDMATLTGAARVALGPDLPPYYTNDDALAASLQAAGLHLADPVWRLPFWEPYDSYLKSKVADVNHIFNGPFAGSITAALFLKRFVRHARRYLHLDIFAWIPRTLPGRPAGGEPQAARALFEIIRNEYPAS